MIILEFAPYGSLWDMVTNRVSYPAIPFSLSLSWLSDLSDALKHVHSKFVVHKDVKCENLLVFNNLKVKLCDFGLAKHNVAGAQSSVAGGGTGCFMAPEIRNGLKSTPASDLFSFAMTAVQLLTRASPRSVNTRY